MNLKSLGVIGACSPRLEQPCGGQRLQAVIPGGVSLVDHYVSLDDGYEMRWLLAHRDSYLNQFIVVLLIQDDGLIDQGFDFILAALSGLPGAEQVVGLLPDEVDVE